EYAAAEGEEAAGDPRLENDAVGSNADDRGARAGGGGLEGQAIRGAVVPKRLRVGDRLKEIRRHDPRPPELTAKLKIEFIVASTPRPRGANSPRPPRAPPP